MARGGYRPGSGRPKKSATKSAIRKEARRLGMTPLEYMLDVMNNPSVPGDRRDRMAIAAAPFVHAKAEAKAEGERERQASRAIEVGVGKYATPAPPPRLVVNNDGA